MLFEDRPFVFPLCDPRADSCLDIRLLASSVLFLPDLASAGDMLQYLRPRYLGMSTLLMHRSIDLVSESTTTSHAFDFACILQRRGPTSYVSGTWEHVLDISM